MPNLNQINPGEQMPDDTETTQTKPRAAENAAPGKDEPQPRPFTQILHDQRKGKLHEEITEQLAELVVACVETQKKGSMALKLTVVPGKDGVTVMLLDELNVKTPQHDKEAGLYFPNAAGGLGRRHPDQAQLPFTSVPAGHDVNPETGEVTPTK